MRIRRMLEVIRNDLPDQFIVVEIPCFRIAIPREIEIRARRKKLDNANVGLHLRPYIFGSAYKVPQMKRTKCTYQKANDHKQEQHV